MTEPARQEPSSALRVLLVTARYYPDMGGVETHCYEVARRLAQAGVDVTVLATARTPGLPEQEVVEGVKIRRVPAWPADRDYYLAPGIWNVIREGGWDLVHVQGVHTLVAPLAMLAARTARIPYVLTFHTGGNSSRLREAIRGAQWTALHPLLAGAARLIGVSRFEARAFRDRLGLPTRRFAVIRNGAHLPPAPAVQDKPSGTLLVSTGRLERYKGHHRVIAALPAILEQRPDTRLLILGAGPYEAELRRQAQALGVADRVEIKAIPSADRAAMATAVASADLVTLLSDYEAHPIAVMESLALKRPVLVADTSGLRELAEDGLVTAINPHSTPEQVAEAVLQQLAHPLVPTNVSLPTWEGCVAELLAVYNSVAKTARATGRAS
jgi:glycosyltransferase involved in cell wall biosynthesis